MSLYKQFTIISVQVWRVLGFKPYSAALRIIMIINILHF